MEKPATSLNSAHAGPPSEVIAASWIWMGGSVLAVVSAVVAVALVPDPLTWVILGLTVLMVAVSIPAAFALTRGARWARITLMVLAALSLGSLYQALKMQAWGSLALNLILGATFAMLTSTNARQFFRTGGGDTSASDNVEH